MPTFTLVLKTYLKTIGGRENRLCGIVAVKGGEVLHKVMDKSTLGDLSRALRSSGYVPTNLTIAKKATIEFQYRSNELPSNKKPERTVPASNFVGTMAANVDNLRVSDKEFRAIFKRTLPIVIYDGCEKAI